MIGGLQNWLADVMTREHVAKFLIAAAILLGGIFIARRVRSTIDNLSQIDSQQKLLLNRLSYYGLLTLSVAAALSQIGVDLKVVLGAAGVLTVAIGFAAQTSASNLISGIFLMVERPFVVGDVIALGDLTGEVMSIDLLSSKIRTFRNLMVRIPNETLVKSNIINYSYFPIRRVDFTLGVAHGTNLNQVEMLLRNLASAHPLCMEDPKPVFLLNGFGESGMNIQFQVWTLAENMISLQNELYRTIKDAFDDNGIMIPYPTRMLINSPPTPGRVHDRSPGPYPQA